MTTKDYTANVISASKVVPDGNFKDSKASGVWDINEALDLIKGGNWPNAANINPSAFVDALFQTHLYNGTSADLSINNDINLSGSGGLVWFKDRNYANNHRLYDTARGIRKYLDSSATAAEATNSGSGNSNGISAFNSNGFTIGNDGYINDSSSEYVSWTFRKQPKFFDVVTYTGNGVLGRTISHSLGSVPGMIIVKRTNGSASWYVYHRGVDSSAPEDYVLLLDGTNARINSSAAWNDTAPTDSVFTVGDNSNFNGSGDTYVAYLFAHNNNDGGFGEPGDQDIIKCGSLTSDTSSNVSVNLGFEPQWILIKNVTSSASWWIVDTLRGMPVVNSNGALATLRANSSDAENTSNYQGIVPTSTGFEVRTAASSTLFGDNQTLIYMAIRRGGMQTPTAASSVFAIDARTGLTPEYVSGFPVDFALVKDSNSSSNWIVNTRLMGGKRIETNTDDAEADDSLAKFDIQNGIRSDAVAGDYGWMWKRARGYSDVATYTGTGSARTVAHNLGVAPEMMWFKCRSDVDIWTVYHSALGEGKRLKLNANTAAEDDTSSFNNTAPTSSVFSVGSLGQIGGNGRTYIAYLFATVAGVSKVGSFTQSGATNVDCGFTGDTPSFLLLKRTDTTDNWRVYDAARGLVAGNDKVLNLNRDVAQSDDSNLINPNSGGFATTSTLSNGDYIFYAIAATS